VLPVVAVVLLLSSVVAAGPSVAPCSCAALSCGGTAGTCSSCSCCCSGAGCTKVCTCCTASF